MNFQESIDHTLSQAEGGLLDTTIFFKELATEQSEIFTFLFDEDTRLLLEPEHDYLLFMAMVILEVLKKEHGNLDAIDIDQLEELAENNWGLLEHTSIETITETTSDHPGYVLYQFLEEGCTPQTEHEVLSEAAVELVYVKCKSLIDNAFVGK